MNADSWLSSSGCKTSFFSTTASSLISGLDFFLLGLILTFSDSSETSDLFLSNFISWDSVGNSSDLVAFSSTDFRGFLSLNEDSWLSSSGCKISFFSTAASSLISGFDFFLAGLILTFSDSSETSDLFLSNLMACSSISIWVSSSSSLSETGSFGLGNLNSLSRSSSSGCKISFFSTAASSLISGFDFLRFDLIFTLSSEVSSPAFGSFANLIVSTGAEFNFKWKSKLVR